MNGSKLMIELKRQDGTPLLQVHHVLPETPRVEVWKYGVLWHDVDEIDIALGDAHWYGQGGLVHQQYPLEKLAQYPAPFITSDNGATGLLGILEPFWFSSNGAGILVGADDFVTSFNAPLQGRPHDHSFTQPAPLSERPRLVEGIVTDGLLRIHGKNMIIRFFCLSNPREVVEAYWEGLQLSPPPPDALLEKVLWTTWAHFKNDISHEKVVAFAEKIVHYGFNCGVFGIDAKWQDEFGSTRFDPVKFPDPAATVEALHALDMKVTLWAIPFFHPQTEHYQTALERGYTLKRRDNSPYIRDWWEGQAALLDVTSRKAMRWHLDNLQALAEAVGVDGFKFDAGEAMFYAMRDVQLAAHPNQANRLYIEQIAKRFAWSDVRSGWRNQAQPMLFRQWDKSTGWGFDNGLASCITGAITLNLLGYRFSFPDMIGGNLYGSQAITAELLIRWTQAVAPMPIIQFSLAPWDYGEECANLCARYARFHSELSARTRQIASEPTPIVRPLWWIAPTDEAALVCNDSYLIGDDLLVAPIIEEGARARDIYLPNGRWRSYWNGEEIHEGGVWLRDYPAPLDVLPLFERVGGAG